MPAVKNARSGGWRNAVTGQPQRLDGTAISQAPPIVGSQVPEVQMEDEEDLDDDRLDEPTPVQPRPRVKFVDSTGKERIIGNANTEPESPKLKNVTLHNMIKKAAEENPHAVIEKLLRTVVHDITVSNLLEPAVETRKLIFKPNAPKKMDKLHVNMGSLKMAVREARAMERDNSICLVDVL